MPFYFSPAVTERLWKVIVVLTAILHYIYTHIYIISPLKLNSDGRGFEISKDGINKCFKSGLSVVQGDIVAGLDYPKKSFDFVILSQTIQTISSPTTALTEMLRVGKMAIVSFPNFGHWLVRLSFLSRGSMPMTKSLPYKWYNTPNVHLCTIQDFVNLCKDLKISINQIYILGFRNKIDRLFNTGKHYGRKKRIFSKDYRISNFVSQ